MPNYTSICSNHNCNCRVNYVTEFSSAPKFCTECGNAMISTCPKCKEELVQTTKEYCKDCGAKIKP